MSKFRFSVIFLVLAATVVAMAAPVKRGSGKGLCVLTQADFRAFGTLVESRPKVNLDNDSSAYCVYRGKSGATGGVELDVFYSAGGSATDIDNVWSAVLGSDGANVPWAPEGLGGVDKSVYNLKIPQPGYFPFAANAVRRGDLIFTISLPSSPLSKVELMKLSQLVLARLAK